MDQQFERTFNVAKWLMSRLAGDEDLLRALMGGMRQTSMHEAMGTLEREAGAQGWSRVDIDIALRKIEVN